jgi:hypothetical protein
MEIHCDVGTMNSMPWDEELLGVAYLLLPLLGGALLHGLCMRFGWLAFLKRPIDGGVLWRGRAVFGPSKTWRGPVTVAIGTGCVLVVQASVLHRDPAIAAIELFDYSGVSPFLLGAAAGSLAELAELPNSFVKRRLGIAPSATARGWLSVVFYLWDQLDLLVGYWLGIAGVVTPTPRRVLFTVAIVLALHPLTTLAGYLLGMRPTAR